MFGKRSRPSTPARRSEPAEASGADALPPEAPPRLVDLAGDWLTLVAALRRCPEIPDPDRLRARALELRNDFERQARERQFDDGDIRAATFSLAAFTDEVVRRSRGRARDEWIARALQLEWFQTNNAGVEFYDQLDEMRRDRGRRIEALEVATCCLGLGFEGKLGMAPEQRTTLIDSLLIDLAAVRGAGEIPLAPHAIGRDRPVAAPVPEIPRWISAVAFGLAALLIWFAITQASRLAFKDAATQVDHVSRR